MHDEEQVTYFGQTDSRNRRVKFGVKNKDRSRHVYVIGKTGMGKSTLLENMAIQDIQNGEGMAFIDPHGKSAEQLLDYVPRERVNDVIHFAPHDIEYPVSFNVMEDVGADRRHLVASGLMSAFKKIWVDAWSARMEYILNNILLALLEYPDSTLIGVNRMLADKTYRDKVVDNVTDTSVKAFWTDEFAKYGERYMQEAGASIQNKIGQFISNPIIRNIIGQPHSTFDLRKVMDEQKLVIMDLSKGKIGETNANLLGSMLITKLYLSAMSRAEASDEVMKTLPPFYAYVDEFQSFANESFADILSESRKYKLSLTMAHQYIEQMSEEVRAAVFGNVGTMMMFRVGAYDAEILEKEFAPQFSANDMVNLGFTQMYLKLMIDGVTSPPFSATSIPPIDPPPQTFRDLIVESSRQQYARHRSEIEQEIRDWHADSGSDAVPASEKQGGHGGGKGKKNDGKQGGGKQQQDQKQKGKGKEHKEKDSNELRSILADLSKKHKSDDEQSEQKSEADEKQRSVSQQKEKPKKQAKRDDQQHSDDKSSNEARNPLRDALKQQGLIDESGAARAAEPKPAQQPEKKQPNTSQPTQEQKQTQTQKPKTQKNKKEQRETNQGKTAETKQEESTGKQAQQQSSDTAQTNEVPKQVLDDLLKMDEEYDGDAFSTSDNQ